VELVVVLVIVLTVVIVGAFSVTRTCWFQFVASKFAEIEKAVSERKVDSMAELAVVCSHRVNGGEGSLSSMTHCFCNL
jgi:hypothetical protein